METRNLGPLASYPGVPSPKLDRGRWTCCLDHETVHALLSHCLPTEGNGTKATKQKNKQILVGVYSAKPHKVFFFTAFTSVKSL